jgi:UDP-glucuronate 4-epimerase
MSQRVLVTGSAGFIGFHVAKWLLDAGREVIGFDNLNDYYSPQLKEDRLAQLQGNRLFTFKLATLEDGQQVQEVFADYRPRSVIHLAAQAGVRYSLDHPRAYVKSNVEGFLNILEGCRHHHVDHLVFASSSSVYGANSQTPFRESDRTDTPVSLYAATKKANELMAYTYSHLFQIPSTGLRFFTVYGPWGRPDMAYYKFAESILIGKPIEVFEGGRLWRDFTYIDDIVQGVIRILDEPPAPSIDPPCRVFNIGNRQPVQVNDFLAILEKLLERPAIRVDRPMQPGDVISTEANTDALEQAIGFQPQTPLEEGLKRFLDWYLVYSQQDRLRQLRF